MLTLDTAKGAIVLSATSNHSGRYEGELSPDFQSLLVADDCSRVWYTVYLTEFAFNANLQCILEAFREGLGTDHFAKSRIPVGGRVSVL
jgi:hypothetical protein